MFSLVPVINTICVYITVYYNILQNIMLQFEDITTRKREQVLFSTTIKIICMYYSILQHITECHFAVLRYHDEDEGICSL